MSTADREAASGKGQKPALWVCSTYFAEGLPYMVVNELAVPLFKHLGASLGAIGMTALFHAPWNLKFLWGHLIDGYETKRRWLLATEVVLAVALVGLAFIADHGAMIGAISAAFMFIAVLSANHDIAIDGFYLEALEERDQSRLVGLRTMAYRLAMLAIAGPGLVAIARFGWTPSLFGIAAAMGALLLFHTFVLPRTEPRKRPLAELFTAAVAARVLAAGAALALVIVLFRELELGSSLRPLSRLFPFTALQWINIALLAALATLLVFRKRIERRLSSSSSDFARSYQSFVAQRRVGVILAFIVSFRVGESLLIKMKLPFLLDEIGMSLESYGWANGTVGLVASITSTLVGGWLISHRGLKRWVWPFVLAQNVLNLLYVGLAHAAGSGIGIPLATFVIVLERVGEGLGTSVFMVYLMRCCSPHHKAAHMAIATALMSVGFTLAGTYSGFVAEATGFRLYFLLSFLITLPAMALIPFLPHLDGREEPEAPAPSTA